MNTDNLEKLFEFLGVVNNLKFTYRYSTNPKLNNESTAAHSWMLSLLVLFIVDEFKLKVDTLKAVKMAIVHDLAEAETGDIDYTLIVSGKEKRADKDRNELIAMKKYMKILPDCKMKEEIFSLWDEYNKNETPEANLVKTLDKAESQLHVLNFSVKDAFINKTDALIEYNYADPYVEKIKELKPLIDLIKEKLIAKGIKIIK